MHVDHLSEDSDDKADASSLTGLVNSLWKVVATKPELDTPVARQKLQNMIRELESAAGIANGHEQDMLADKDEESKHHAASERKGYQSIENPRAPKPPGISPFLFLPNWF